MEFLKEMFSKPSVLWTIGEQLVMTIFVLVGLAIIIVGIYLSILMVEKIKHRKRKNKKHK